MKHHFSSDSISWNYGMVDGQGHEYTSQACGLINNERGILYHDEQALLVAIQVALQTFCMIIDEVHCKTILL